MKKNRKIALNNVMHRLVTAVSVILIIVAVLFLNAPNQLDVHVGSIAPEDVYAPREVINEEETEKARSIEREKVDSTEFTYTDTEIGKEAAKSVDSFFALAETYRASVDDTNKKTIELKENSELGISYETALATIVASDAQFKTMKGISAIVGEEMKKAVTDVSKSRENCDQQVDALILYPNQKTAAKEIISLVLTANQVIDETKYKEAQNAAANAVQPINYKKDALIIQK